MTPLQIERLRELVRFSGPCITIYLPAHRPGEQTLHSPARLLRNFVEQAERALETFPLDGRQRDDLLQPLRAMAQNPATDEGCHWPRVLLRAADVFETVFLREPAAARVIAGRRFHILPLLGEMDLPAEFYVLKISRKTAALFHGDFSLEPFPLPPGVPARIDDFLELEKPDHDLENRSGGRAPNRRIRFGTGSERETEPAYLTDYYVAVDRGVRELARQAPMILSGVEEDIALYRAASAGANLLSEALRDVPPDRETMERCYAILRGAASRKTAELLAEARERLAPARFTHDTGAIASSAAEGRVARLFVRAAADSEELNAAAVETLRHGGDALIASPAAMAEATAAAALRF